VTILTKGEIYMSELKELIAKAKQKNVKAMEELFRAAGLRHLRQDRFRDGQTGRYDALWKRY
ncbi:MAG: hypothetical protein KKB85_02245, partial [Candidatus Altiarchaeota archaeon]|nr:hypothetical protein [Candidatus Altiarchaeota archaeon]